MLAPEDVNWEIDHSAVVEGSEIADDEPFLATFLFGLPECLPVTHHSTSLQMLSEKEEALEGYDALKQVFGDDGCGESHDGYNFVSLRVWQVPKTGAKMEMAWRAVAYGEVVRALSPKASDVDDDYDGWENFDDDDQEMFTVVEAVTFVPDGTIMLDTRTATPVLDKCLEALIQFHRAYRISTRTIVSEISPQRLTPVVAYFRKPFDGVDLPPVPSGYIELKHAHVEFPPDEALDVEMTERLAHFQARIITGDPFTAYLERCLESEIERDRHGRMGEALVQLGTASEVLLDGLLGLMLWEQQLVDGVDHKAAGATLSGPFAPRLKREYGSRLGGQWNTNVEPLRGWDQRVWKPRSRILHGAWRPTRAQVVDAKGAMTALETHIGDRLKAKWREYPHTAWLFLGDPGFEARGNPRKALEWRDAQPDKPAQWAHQYSIWREAVTPYIDRS